MNPTPYQPQGNPSIPTETATPKKKSPYKWPIIALIFPPIGLVLSALLQIVVRATVLKDGNANGVAIALNIFSALVGIACVVMFLLAPIWLLIVSRGEKEREAKRRESLNQQ